METHVIRKVQSGVYHVLLDFPHSYLLRHLLDEEWPYVWVHRYETKPSGWALRALPLFEDDEPHEVLTKGTEIDFVMPTARFLDVVDRFPWYAIAGQVREVPPERFDPSRLKGPAFYRSLSEIGWRFWLETPGNDFGSLLTPYREVAEAAVAYVEQTVAQQAGKAEAMEREWEERRLGERKEALRERLEARHP